MRSLVYLATQTRPISDAELLQIFDVLGEHYAALQLTGTLVVQQANWFAALEGEHDLVQSVLEQARRDPRITNLQVIADEEIPCRSFADWTAADKSAGLAATAAVTPRGRTAADRGMTAGLGSSRASELLAWFRKHPLGPLVGPRGTEDRAVRERGVAGAIAALHDVGVAQFRLELAAAYADIPEERLLALFPTKDTLLAATLDQWTQETWTPLLPLIPNAGAISFLRALLLVAAEHPVFIEMQLACLAAAADPFADLADYHRSSYRTLQHLLRTGLTADVEIGREPTPLGVPDVVELLLALYNGLQLQALLSSSSSLTDPFDHAITLLRQAPSRTRASRDHRSTEAQPVLQQGQA